MPFETVHHAHFSPDLRDILADAVDKYREKNNFDEFTNTLAENGFSKPAISEYVRLVDTTVLL